MTEKINKGFDRDIDFEPIKEKLIEEYNKELKHFCEKNYKKRAGRNLIYLLIELIQLKNGSRITESINAFKKFINGDYNEKVIVKISKSEGVKYVVNKFDKDKKRVKIITKPRYRKLMFPNTWINTTKLNELLQNLNKTHEKLINDPNLRLNITKYMNRRFNCNTHSLRYAFINYMIYVQMRPLNDVAKFVGHANTNQLVTYTQQKNCDKIFELDF